MIQISDPRFALSLYQPKKKLSYMRRGLKKLHSQVSKYSQELHVEQAYVGIYYLAQSLDSFAAQCNT